MFTKEAYEYEKFEKAIKDPGKQPMIRVLISDDNEWREVQVIEKNGEEIYINSAGEEVNIDNFEAFCLF